jgi:DNA-binding NtrC family response regulator
MLERRGCVVAAVGSRDDVVHEIDRHRSNVVVLDVSNSLTSAAPTIAAIAALPARVEVIAVSDQQEQAAFVGLRLLPKWRSLPHLADEVEAAYRRDDEPEETRLATG